VIRSKSKGGLLWIVDTVALKDEYFAALKVEADGPGKIYFGAEVDEAFFDQLLSSTETETIYSLYSLMRELYRPRY